MDWNWVFQKEEKEKKEEKEEKKKEEEGEMNTAANCLRPFQFMSSQQWESVEL